MTMPDWTGNAPADGVAGSSLDLAQAVIEAVPANIAVLDRNGVIVAVNESWRQFATANGAPDHRSTGVGANYLTVTSTARGRGADGAETVAEGIRAVQEGRAGYFVHDYPCDAPDRRRWVRMHVRPIGHPLGLTLVSHFDTTSGLPGPEADERFRLLAERVPDHAIFLLDPAGTVATWNLGAERIFGYAAAEIVGEPLARLYPAADRADGAPARDLARAARTPLAHEGWRVRRDGSTFWAAGLTVALTDAAGRDRGYAGIFRDTTAQRYAAESLRSVVDHSIDALVTIDDRGTIVTTGGAAEKLFGYTGAELAGRNVRVLMPDEWGRTHDRHVADYVRTGAAKIIGIGREVVGRRKDGTTFPVELTITEFDLDGRRFFTGILRDITERRRLEQQLRQSQQLEAIGLLAGGVAHDFNNLLTVILSCAGLLAAHIGTDAGREMLQEIHRAGERAAALSHQLLEFGRVRPRAATALDLPAALADAASLVRRLLGPDIRFDLSVARDVCPVAIDPGVVEQVVMNLVLNARDAMPQGGAIAIGAATADLAPAAARPHPDARPGRYAVVTVRDTGHGMPPDVLARVFEPFFTTKPAGQGTGLGLATVRRIVRENGGFVTIASEPGRGTTVAVHLQAAAPRAGVSIATPPPPRGSATILVAEDEAAIRTFLQLFLRAQGYTVLAASDGDEAARLSAAHDGPIHLLLTDVVMPGMSGTDLAAVLAGQRPGIRIAYLSAVGPGAEAGAAHVVRKPCTPEQLAAEIRRALGAGEPPP